MTGAFALCPASRRRFSWTEEDLSLSFKVKAEDVNMNKLAGGIHLRCEQRLETHLEPMGNKAVYNCIKAIVLANRFAAEARQEEGKKQALVTRIGFIPSLARREELLWMRLTVVAFGSRSSASSPPKQERQPAGPEGPTLKVGANTDLEKLRQAIVANWMQRCAGSLGDPRVSAMGGASVAKAVKGSAFALREMARRKVGARPFLCFPTMELVRGTEEQGREMQTVTFLSLEPRPAPGDNRSDVLTPLGGPSHKP